MEPRGDARASCRRGGRSEDGSVATTRACLFGVVLPALSRGVAHAVDRVRFAVEGRAPTPCSDFATHPLSSWGTHTAAVEAAACARCGVPLRTAVASRLVGIACFRTGKWPLFWRESLLQAAIWGERVRDISSKLVKSVQRRCF